MTPKRFEHKLRKYQAVTSSQGCVPTFAVTAVTLARHPESLREFSQQGAEFAVHGYIHTDYRVLSLDEQVRHFRKGIDTFKDCRIPFLGFRAPFLRINGHTSEVLGELGFLYDSSHVVHWDVIDLTKRSESSQDAYARLIEFYQPQNAETHLSLPRFIDGIVEIPVSIPDDEALVDRLEITDKMEISKIWEAILDETYDRGELFTVQLHPERIPFCDTALAQVLQKAKDLPIWTTTLGEIAEWWREKDKFSFELSPEGEGRYRIKAHCSDRATLLVKHCRVNHPVSQWAEGYESVKARDFILESPVRPVIGVSRNSSSAAVDFLKSEGYIVEQSDQPQGYAVYLDSLDQFEETNEKPLSDMLESLDVPLIRYWRWPDHTRSALAITGDIDSLTIIDFILRIIENWRYNGKGNSVKTSP
jgi:peptidoglycan/xylan/chitin deacetylase (PgdA/CDA1 family)